VNDTDACDTPITSLGGSAFSDQHPDTWLFDKRQGSLINNDVIVSLTRTECILLDLLANSVDRVVSKDEILRGMKKDHDRYNGMAMCLSRLQAKFKAYTDGEPLLRSVRNRGYCLVQEIGLFPTPAYSAHKKTSHP
jgi:DNA-binding winged helix-turn-helix (wHTH) protein